MSSIVFLLSLSSKYPISLKHFFLIIAALGLPTFLKNKSLKYLDSYEKEFNYYLLTFPTTYSGHYGENKAGCFLGIQENLSKIQRCLFR